MRRKSLLFVLVLFAGLALVTAQGPPCNCDGYCETTTMPFEDQGECGDCNGMIKDRGCDCDGDCEEPREGPECTDCGGGECQEAMGWDCKSHPAECACPPDADCKGKGFDGADPRGCVSQTTSGCEPTTMDCKSNPDGCPCDTTTAPDCVGKGQTGADERGCAPCMDPEDTYCPPAGCVDTDGDTEHCGSCTNVCKSTQDCIGGKCEDQPFCGDGTCNGYEPESQDCAKDCGCPDGRGDCDNDGMKCEADLYSMDTCGSCANSCSTNQECDKGECIAVKCTDGTPLYQCSSTKPFYCDTGMQRVKRPDKCGCPNGYELSGEECVKETTSGTGAGTDKACNMNKECEDALGENCEVCPFDCPCSDADPCTLDLCSGRICSNPVDADMYGEKVTIGGAPAICCIVGYVKYGECCDDHLCNEGYECVDNKCNKKAGTEPATECTSASQCTKAPYGTCTSTECTSSGQCEYDIDCSACDTGSDSWCAHCRNEGYCCGPEDCPDDGKVYECLFNKCRVKTVEQATSTAEPTVKPDPVQPIKTGHEESVTLRLFEPVPFCGYTLVYEGLPSHEKAVVSVTMLNGEVKPVTLDYREARASANEVTETSVGELTLHVHKEMSLSAETAEVRLIKDGECPGTGEPGPGDARFEIACDDVTVRGDESVDVTCRFKAGGTVAELVAIVEYEGRINVEPDSFVLDSLSGEEEKILTVSADHTCEEFTSSYRVTGTFSFEGEEQTHGPGYTVAVLPAEGCFACGDGTCEAGEGHESCCEDCPCPEGFACEQNACLEEGVSYFPVTFEQGRWTFYNGYQVRAGIDLGANNVNFDVHHFMGDHVSFGVGYYDGITNTDYFGALRFVQREEDCELTEREATLLVGVRPEEIEVPEVPAEVQLESVNLNINEDGGIVYKGLTLVLDRISDDGNVAFITATTPYGDDGQVGFILRDNDGIDDAADVEGLWIAQREGKPSIYPGVVTLLVGISEGGAVEPGKGPAPPEEGPRDIGERCTDGGGCMSGNCQNGVCCLQDNTCCTEDKHCYEDEVCNRERFYCVDKKVEAPQGKPDGTPCLAPEECASGNCGNMRCCEVPRLCCWSDRHCEPHGEVCDRDRSFCVEPGPPEDVDTDELGRELISVKDQAVVASQGALNSITDLLGHLPEENKRAMRKIGIEKRIEERVRRIEKLTEELEELEGRLEEAPGQAMKKMRKLERAVERAKDHAATDVLHVSASDERDVEAPENIVEMVLGEVLGMPPDRLSETKEKAEKLKETVKQRVKAEVVEATYESGRKAKHTVFSRTFENTAAEPVEGAVIILEVGVANTALEVHYLCERSSGRPCPEPRVLRDNPIVGWDLGMLEAGESVTTSYTVEGELPPEDADRGAAMVTTDLDISQYRTVEEEKAELQPEAIERELESLAEEAKSIEDPQMRARFEELAMNTQAELEDEELVSAHATIAQIRAEIQGAREAAEGKPPGDAGAGATPVPPKTPSKDDDQGLLFGIIPTDKDGLVKFFKEYWEIVAAFIGSLSIIAYYLKVLKRKTIGEEAVVIRRGKTMEGNAVKLGIKVKNDSTFKITEVKVTIDYPKAFKVQGGSPTVELGNIRPDEFQSAIFHLVPTRCVKGTVTGYATYENNKGQTKVVQIDPVDVGSVCPFLERVRLTPQEFAQKRQYLQSGTKSMSLRSDPTQIFQVIKTRFNNIHTVHEEVSPDRTSMLGEYSGQGAYSKAFIGASVKVIYGAQGQVELSVYGEDEAMVTGLLSELVDLIEKEEGGGQQV